MITNKTISFGTDGIRADANDFPFTAKALHALGTAIAQWATEKYKTDAPGVLIGCDTRLSSPRIKRELLAGLIPYQLHIVDGGIIPTPAVYQLIKDDSQFNFGIVISASHNHHHDNGIKLFDALTSKISQEDEKIIETKFAATYAQQEIPASVLVTQAAVTKWPEASTKYQEKVASYFKQDFLKGIKIVLDCANGANYTIAPRIFTHFGAEVTAIANTPIGTNINEHCGATHPEVLKTKVQETHADIGFGFDGDGDRLVVVNKNGDIKNGDDVLYLVSLLPEFSNTKALVGTVMSNQGLEQILTNQNKKLIRTSVGDKYVAEALATNNLPLGGEHSGHTIIQNYMPTSDGIFVALKVLEAVIMHNNWELKTFDAYPQVLLNLPVATKRDLTTPALANLIAAYEQKIQTGRILVRYSGTEKVLRVMTEAQSHDLAMTTAKELAHELEQALSA